MVERQPSTRASRLALAAAAVLSIVITAVLITCIYRPVGGGVDMYDRPIGQDFINVWAAPHLATHGQLASLFDMDSYADNVDSLFGHKLQQYVWSYPPLTLLFYYPFSLPPYFIAIGLWTALGLALWMMIYRAYAGRLDIKAAVFLVLSPACAMNVIDGQNGFYAATLFIGGLLLLPRRPVIAGVLFGLLTFKPQIGIILPFALITLREWKAIAAAAITFGVLVVVSVLCFGIEAWVKYVTITSGWQMGALVELAGLASRMAVAPLIGLRTIGMDPVHALAMQMAISLFVTIITCQMLRRTCDTRQRIFLLCGAAPLVSPYLLNYDLCLITVPVTAWLMTSSSSDVRRFALYLAAWLMPTLGFILALSPLRGLQAFVTATLVGIFVTTVIDIQKRFEQGDGTPPVAALS